MRSSRQMLHLKTVTDFGSLRPLLVQPSSRSSSSDDKLQVAKTLGATRLINYRKTPDWSAEVLSDYEWCRCGSCGRCRGRRLGRAYSQSHPLRWCHRFSRTVVRRPDPRRSISSKTCFSEQRPCMACWALGVRRWQLRRQHSWRSIISIRRSPEVFDFEQMEKALDATRKLSEPGKVVVRV